MKKTSTKQIKANRENGKKGGVKTKQGKAVSRYNAIKHGLLSAEVIMADEDEELLLELEKRLRNELKPATEIELLLVDRIASNIWRLKRALSIEDEEVITKDTFNGGLRLKNDADLFFRYETMLEKSIYKSLHELERLQAIRNNINTTPPIALDVDISNSN